MQKTGKKTRKMSTEEVIAGAAQHLTGERLSLIRMQLRHARKKAWNEEEKYFALQVHSRGAINKYLRNRKKIALRCKTLVEKWMNTTIVTPGFNPAVFAKLKEKVLAMETWERDCVLMWDEMSIRKVVEYDLRLDCVTGFEDLGKYGRSNQIGNHALVFMIRGLRSSWKQLIAYFIPHGTVQSEVPKRMIDEAIHRVFDCGLRVRHMVCDQAQTNVSAINALMDAGKQAEASAASSPLDHQAQGNASSNTSATASSPNDLAEESANADTSLPKVIPFIYFKGYQIYFGFDIPHLLKGMWNNLFARDFFLLLLLIGSDEEMIPLGEGEVVSDEKKEIRMSWAAIKELRELEKTIVIQAATKLTESC